MGDGKSTPRVSRANRKRVSLGDLSLTLDLRHAPFVGRIGKAGADFHNVQLQPGSIIDDLDSETLSPSSKPVQPCV